MTILATSHDFPSQAITYHSAESIIFSNRPNSCHLVLADRALEKLI
jgi:hypothetical protein